MQHFNGVTFLELFCPFILQGTYKYSSSYFLILSTTTRTFFFFFVTDRTETIILISNLHVKEDN